MCLGIPGEVVELYTDRADLAKVDVSGVRRAINIGLLEDENDPARRLGPDPRRVRPLQDRRGGGRRRPGLPGRNRSGLRRGVGGAGRLPDRVREAVRMRFVDEFRDAEKARAAVGPDRRRCASRAGSTSSWRCAAGTRTPSTSTASRTTSPRGSRSSTARAARSACIPMGRLDDAIAIAEQPDVIMTTFGDMMRVPGGRGSFFDSKANGRRHPDGVLAARLAEDRQAEPRQAGRLHGHRVRDHGAVARP